MLGIIPIAGQGSRWGLFQKELLPIGQDKWLVDAPLEALIKAGCNRICIVTSPTKAHIHINHFEKEKYKPYNIFYVIQKERLDIWGAIKATFPYTESINLFAMGDTLIEPTAFNDFESHNFSLGLFNTNLSERFGILHNGRIINKTKLEGESFKAWGVLTWTRTVKNSWEVNEVQDYTSAINLGIDIYGLHTFEIGSYIDFARYEDYKAWIKTQ